MKCNDIGEHVTISATVLDGIREINRRLTMLERESIEISKQSTKAIKHQQHQARPEGRAKQYLENFKLLLELHYGLHLLHAL